MFVIEGTCAAPNTPFHENGDLNLDALGQYIDLHVEYGMQNVFICGTMGEGLNMTLDERKQVMKAWVDLGKNQLNEKGERKLRGIVAHVGTCNLRDTVELAMYAESIGVDAISSISPFYYKPNDEEALIEYLKIVAAAAPSTSFYYYDIDFMTNVHLSNKRICELADDHIPTFVGMKHTSKDLISVEQCVTHGGGKYHIALGSDQLFGPSLALGVKVQISLPFMGHVMQRILDYYNNGQQENLRREIRKTCELWELFSKHGDIFVIVKATTRLLGANVGPNRLPFQNIDKNAEAKLKQDLESFNFFEWIKK